MATTPIWVPLVVALLGLGGILFTQHRADRREDARWQRERERERASWAREDAARSYEQRREAYVAFIKEFRHTCRAYIALTDEELGGRADNEPAFDFLVPLYDSLLQVEIFGTKQAADRAAEAYAELHDGMFGGSEVTDKGLRPLQREVRRDLSIPDRPDEPATA
ncbi:MAG: hypothetical protein WCE78_10955 [Pseudonocardiaceae bacterium]